LGYFFSPVSPGLRRQIEAELMPDAVIVQLRLDRAAERERNQRRSRRSRWRAAASGRGRGDS
jgi:hypothetical protein